MAGELEQQVTSQAGAAAPAESSPGVSPGPAAGAPVAAPSGLAAGAASVPGGTAAPATSGAAGGGLAPQPAGAGAGYTPVHEALRQYGYELPQGLEGHAALQHVVAQARRAQELSQLAAYGQQYMPHAEQFQTWQKQQEAAKQAQVQQQQEWWKAPEYDPSWLSKLYADPQTGEIKALPGADPALAAKYRAWQDHRQGFLDKFSRNPMEAIGPGIEQVARKVAEQMIQERLGGYQAQQTAQGFVQQHSGWLHQRDAQGNLVVDPRTGGAQLSEWGQRFAGYVQEAEQMGLQEIQSQQRYAMNSLQRDYALFKLQQAQAGQTPAAQPTQTPQQQANQDFLARANPPGGQPASAAAVAQGTQVDPNQPRKKLRDMMLDEFKANGVQAGDVLTGV